MRLTGRVKEIRLYYEVLTCLVGNETYNKLLSFRPYLIYKVVEGFVIKLWKIRIEQQYTYHLTCMQINSQKSVHTKNVLFDVIILFFFFDPSG